MFSATAVAARGERRSRPGGPGTWFALYKEHGVHPVAGCLPVLLPMPLWIALYRMCDSRSRRPVTAVLDLHVNAAARLIGAEPTALPTRPTRSTSATCGDLVDSRSAGRKAGGGSRRRWRLTLHPRAAAARRFSAIVWRGGMQDLPRP